MPTTMIDSPEVTQTREMHTAVIHLKIPRAEIQQVMGPAIGEVMATIAAQGLAPAGAVFSHHFRMSPETFDFEVGVPVAAPVQPAGRVVPAKLPATKVARANYRGSYEGLGAAWGEFMQWIEAQGLRQAEDLWESYAVGPESGPDPAKWRTELSRPLLG